MRSVTPTPHVSEGEDEDGLFTGGFTGGLAVDLTVGVLVGLCVAFFVTASLQQICFQPQFLE